MVDQATSFKSPLSLRDIERIDETNLSTLDRHHLRLLAHCLECFKAMEPKRSLGPLPAESLQLEWCLAQQDLSGDRAFISLLLEQFAVAAIQLEIIAATFNKSPLELNLDHLIQASFEASRE